MPCLKSESQMGEVEKQESASSLPVIPRLDRIDRLLQFLEEKHCSSRKLSSSCVIRQSLPEDQEFKTLSSALEEVHHRGTLMERVAMLENRVLQLTLGMDGGNASRSSSSSIADPAKVEDPSDLQAVATQNEDDAAITLQEKPHPLIIQEEASATKPRRKTTRQKRSSPKTRRRKWLRLFQMGC